MFFLSNNIADKKKNRDKKVAMFARQKNRVIEEIETGFHVSDLNTTTKSREMRMSPKLMNR